MASYTAQSREPGRAPIEMGSRTDAWSKETLTFGIIFALFVIYTTYRMFDNQFYFAPWPLASAHEATYLSPYYSPLIPLKILVPNFLPIVGGHMISPAIYILIFPLGFRMTCYYYRKAYYRSYFRDPAACAVPEPRVKARMKYTGERVLPFVVHNFHRFALYAALVFIVLLTYDAIKSFMFHVNGTVRFGVGVGSLIFVTNVVLLSCYTFGCHSFRHLVGGGEDCYSCSALSRTKFGLWQKVSFLNKRHAQFALYSMIWVGVTDIYVNLIARQIIPDLRILF